MNNVKKLIMIIIVLIMSIAAGWFLYSYVKRQSIKKVKLEALRVGTGPVDTLLKVG